MSSTVIVKGQNLDVYDSNGRQYYSYTGSMSVVLESVTLGETGWDLWFSIHDTSKYKFERTENNSTDYIIAPFKKTDQDPPIKIYADGTHIYLGTDPSAYASLSWDANKYGGSYHFEMSPKGNNDSFWWDMGKAELTLGIGIKENAAPAPTQYDVVYNLSNCTVSPQPEKMFDGTKYALTFTLVDGYKYDVGPSAVWQDKRGVPHEGTLSGNVLTLTPTNVIGSIEVTATAIKDTPTTEYGTARVYRVTDSTMDSISEWASNQPETFDISKYIYTLRKFFFNVVADADSTIRFGRYDTKVNAKLVENDEFEIDCGTVSIEGIYKNAIDYDSDIEFYLPFVGPISLPANRVMDSTVSLVYHVNAFNGDCVASIYVNDIEVGRASGNISYEVPYTNTESYSKNIGTVPPQYLANLTPSITISTPIIETTGFIGQRSIVTIGELKGFAKFDNIKSLVIDGTKREIDMIKSLLESGVYLA